MSSVFWSALGGALLGSAIAVAFGAVLVRGMLDRRLASLAAVPVQNADIAPASRSGFTEIAPELVALVRTATESAIRREEVTEWHRPSLAGGTSDDVSEVIRGRLRRASFNAVAARAALNAGIGRFRGAIPADLETELRAFCTRLDSEEDAPSSERKRRLAEDLDAIETRIREALGSGLAA